MGAEGGEQALKKEATTDGEWRRGGKWRFFSELSNSSLVLHCTIFFSSTSMLGTTVTISSK